MGGEYWMRRSPSSRPGYIARLPQALVCPKKAGMGRAVEIIPDRILLLTIPGPTFQSRILEALI